MTNHFHNAAKSDFLNKLSNEIIDNICHFVSSNYNNMQYIV